MAPRNETPTRYEHLFRSGCALFAGGMFLGSAGVASAPGLITPDDSAAGPAESANWYERQPLWSSPASPGWSLPESMRQAPPGNPLISSCSFIEETGANNPLSSAMVEAQSAPAFVDIDNDGDQDVFIGVGGFLGSYDGTVSFFENTGGASSPSFLQRTGTANPLDAITLPGSPAKASLAFVDLDHDGDFDAFLGNEDGLVRLARNDGTATTPSFLVVPSGQNPLSAVDVGSESMPSFVDIDSDGDEDAFIGVGDSFTDPSGTVQFWKNNDFEDDGILNAPSFAQITGAGNPLDAVLVERRAAPAFIDCGSNGISDAIVGEFFDFGINTAKLNFFENTGSAAAPNFVQRTGTANPFDGKFTTIETDRTPAVVDIDGDGDLDVFAGMGSGGVRFFRNSDISLPVELSAFSAVVDDDAVVLRWQTSSEENNAGFEIQHRSSQAAWTVEGFVEGQGTSNASHDYAHRLVGLSPGSHHFRLKQLDLDGSTRYSPEISLTVDLKDAFELSPAFPNPFNPQARFSLIAKQTQFVRVAVYDALGREVRMLHEGELVGGQEYRFTIEGDGLSSGVYLYEVRGETFRETRTVMLVK